MMLSGEQRAFFREEGFLIVPNVLRPPELEILAKEVNLLLELADEKGLDLVEHLGCVLEVFPGQGSLKKEQEDDEENEGILSLETYSKMRSQDLLEETERIYAMQIPMYAKELVGLGAQEEIFLLNEQFIVKPPEAGQRSAFAWHQDGEYSNHSAITSRMVSCWCTIDDLTEMNGTLEIKPKLSSETVVVRAPRGTVVFLSSTVLHRSYPNQSKKYRRAYMPQYSALAPPLCQGKGGEGAGRLGRLMVVRVPGDKRML